MPYRAKLEDYFNYGEFNVINKEMVELILAITDETDQAWLVDNGDEEVWLSKELVEFNADEGSFMVPHWLAYKEGLI